MKIIQMAHQSPVQMMGYILMAPDGSISCIDGGNVQDGPHFLALLHRYGGDKPRVKYWFFTHVHSDHCNAFLALRPRLGVEFTVDHLVYTFPKAENVLKYESWEPEPARMLEEWNPEHIKPKAGDVIDLGGAAMTCLQTFVEEEHDNFINNSTTVWKLESDGVTAIFLADLGIEGGQRLLRTYGAGLKCHIAQMAHHGQNGVQKDVYAAMDPEVCLWNAPGWLWHNTIDPLCPGKGPWKTLETRQWMRELGDKQRHVVTKDGTWELTLSEGKVGIERIETHTGEMS